MSIYPGGSTFSEQMPQHITIHSAPALFACFIKDPVLSKFLSKFLPLVPYTFQSLKLIPTPPAILVLHKGHAANDSGLSLVIFSEASAMRFLWSMAHSSWKHLLQVQL